MYYSHCSHIYFNPSYCSGNLTTVRWNLNIFWLYFFFCLKGCMYLFIALMLVYITVDFQLFIYCRPTWISVKFVNRYQWAMGSSQHMHSWVWRLVELSLWLLEWRFLTAALTIFIFFSYIWQQKTKNLQFFFFFSECRHMMVW